MLFNDQEMQELQGFLESKSELDPELYKWCAPLIHRGKYDDAVRNAFVLVEDRMKRIMNSQKLYGRKLINAVFDEENGPLGKYIIKSNQEREGLRNLFSGAFMLYRNPTAHNFINYSSTQAKAILGLVNLLLMTLDRAKELPSIDTFPENWQRAIDRVEKMIGVEGAARLRIFLADCKQLGFILGGAGEAIPYRSRAMLSAGEGNPPKHGEIRVFYLYASNNLKGANIRFSRKQYEMVFDFDVDWLFHQLDSMGFYPAGRGNYKVNLKKRNDHEFFTELLQLVSQVKTKLDDQRNTY